MHHHLVICGCKIGYFSYFSLFTDNMSLNFNEKEVPNNPKQLKKCVNEYIHLLCKLLFYQVANLLPVTNLSRFRLVV